MYWSAQLRRPAAAWVMALLLCLVIVLPAGAKEKALFNGRNLEGWVREGPRASFAARNGVLRTEGEGNFPNWIRTADEYEDFRLRFDYKLDQWAEAAVYLRAPRAGRPGRAGLAIVLAHDFHEKVTPYVTGAIRGVRQPRQTVAGDWGEWHTVEIDLTGDRLTVAIDEVVTQEVILADDPELRYRLKRGFVGFPDLGHGYSVRNIRIEDHGFQTEFVELPASDSFAGWDLRGGADWMIRDGVVRAFNGHGIYYAPGEFADFEFTALVRSHQRVNGGVFFRGGSEGPRGFEVQIYSPPNAVYPTGSIYNLVRSQISADFEDRWFLMQVIVRGRRCLVRLDGETVAETDRLPSDLPASGRIGLQMHTDDASVEFRDLRVRPLPKAR